MPEVLSGGTETAAAGNYDPLPDLGKLIQAAIWGHHDAIMYGERVAQGLGIGEDDSAEKAAEALRKALGLRTEAP